MDLIFLHVATYALSSTVLPVVRRAKVPVILLNLSPQSAIDYAAFNRMGDRTRMTGEWLAHCQACSVPEIANVFLRCGIDFHQVTGMMDAADAAWAEVADWMAASRTAHAMEHNRLGVMGHYYSGMLDIYSDLTLQAKVFGTHIEILEVDELSALRREVADEAIAERVGLMREAFDVQPECSQMELERAARTSVALDRLVAKHRLGSMAYYYKGSGIAENEDTLSSIIVGNSLLTARGIPVAGELEIKNVQAMKILDCLGAGGSFSEFYATDLNDDVVLLGHDGPGHVAIAEGKPKVRPLGVYHGKVGSGLSIEMSVKHGPVTLLSVAEDGKGGLKLVVAEGESVPGPDSRDRQHQQPLPVLHRRAGVHSAVEQPGRGPSLRHRRGAARRATIETGSVARHRVRARLLAGLLPSAVAASAAECSVVRDAQRKTPWIFGLLSGTNSAHLIELKGKGLPADFHPTRISPACIFRFAAGSCLTMLLGDQSQTFRCGLNAGELCLLFAGKKETGDEIRSPESGCGGGGRSVGLVCAWSPVCGWFDCCAGPEPDS